MVVFHRKSLGPEKREPGFENLSREAFLWRRQDGRQKPHFHRQLNPRMNLNAGGAGAARAFGVFTGMFLSSATHPKNARHPTWNDATEPLPEWDGVVRDVRWTASRVRRLRFRWPEW